MAKPNQCPPDKTLKELIQGKINEPQLSELSAHLETCGGCQEKAKTLSPFDTFTEPLRSDPGLAKKIAAGIPRPLIEKVKSIARAKDNTVGVSQQGPPTHASAEEVNLDFLAPPQQPDEIGRLGSYRILKVLGKGGMGMVFLGHDPHLDRSVALKVMLPKFAANEGAKQRFLREARTAAKLHHDHIVSIYQVGEDRGVPYLAMEFLEGAPLDQFLQNDRKLSLAQILRITREIAKGLSAAHEKGLIHRDIKPGNIWLDKANAGRAKILDFGLARSDKDDIHLTQSGAIVGTPAYMAPEQARGDKAVDARADLFSLGCVLYRLCVGDIPFKGDTTMNVLMALAMTDPTPPKKINAQIPETLSDLTMQLLDKDPNNRPASAKEVIAKIQQIERDLKGAKSEVSKTQAVEPVLMAHPVSMASARPVKRRRSPVLVGVAAGLAAVALIAAGIIFYWQTNNGIVKIEINDPDIKVTIDKDVAIIAGVAKHEIKLRAGEYGLTVEHGDLKFHTDKFILKRQETVALKIEMMKGPLMIVTRDGKLIGQVEGPVAVAPPPPVVAKGPHALVFDGKSSYVKVPSFRYEGATPLTVEAWAVFERPMDDPAPEVFLGNPDSSGFAIRKWSRPLAYSFCVSMRGQTPGVYEMAKEKQPLPRNQLVHVAGVYDGKAEVRFYVNGLLQNRAPAKGVHKPSPMVLTLGANPFPNDEFRDHFLGRMQGVRLSKFARYDDNFTPAKQFEADKDTLALYHFDEGSGSVLKDSSGNGHHGTIVGAKWVKADGTRIAPVETGHYALHFSGKRQGQDQVVVLPAALTVDAAGDFTLEGFVNLSGNYALLVGTPAITVQTFTQPWRFQVYAAEGKPVSVNDTKGPATQYAKRRVHIAGVRAGGKLRLFVDGRLVGAEAFDGKLFTRPDQVLRIGPADGVIDEVRISKIARYDKDFTPAKRFEPDKDTLALYHFDEGSGDVLKDSSGNGHHGTIVGAKWVKADGSPIVRQVGDWALDFIPSTEVRVPSLQMGPSDSLCLEGYVQPRKILDKNYTSAIMGFRGQFTLVHNAPSPAKWSASQYLLGKTDIGARSKEPILLGKRVHVAAVRQGDEIRLYLDGKKIGATRFPVEKQVATKAGFYMGLGFEGMIDEVRISKIARYDKEFTPAQRFETDKDTLALYHFDEGTGDVLKDSSGNGHHGKIVGAKWVKVETPPPGPWRSLFNGKDFAGWTIWNPKNDGKAEYVSEDGLPAVRLSGSFNLRTPAYGDFHLRFEAKSDENHKGPGAQVYQGGDFSLGSQFYNLMRQTKPMLYLSGHGSNYQEGVLRNGRIEPVGEMPKLPRTLGFKVNTAGPWVRMEIIRQGDSLVYLVNGNVVGALTNLRDTRIGKEELFGPLNVKFQAGDGPLFLRNVEVRDISALPPELFSPFSPLDPAWLKAVAAMKAEQQVEAVKAELMKRNPGFDGAITPTINKAGVVSSLAFITDNVADISPVRALTGLTQLHCSGTAPGKGKLADLGQLKGMKLTYLECHYTDVSDLSPLKGMPLGYLVCSSTQVSDLSPLRDMKLRTLFVGGSKVADLSPLKDMTTLKDLGIWQMPVSDLSLLKGLQLTELNCNRTEISSLEPLKDMKLVKLNCYVTNVSDLTPLKGMPLTKLDVRATKVSDLSLLKGMPLKDVWCDFKAERDAAILRSIPTLEKINERDAKEVLNGASISAFPPLDPAWLKAVAAMKPEEQVEAVKAELIKRNPGFDGKFFPLKIEAGDVAEFGFDSENVTDISPVRALTGLRSLHCSVWRQEALGKGPITDLSPLKGMKLTHLTIRGTMVSDLSPLKDMKLTSLHFGVTKVADLSPLRDMPLTDLHFEVTQVSDLSPLKGMKLTNLECYYTNVSDLSPLKDMPLRSLNISHTRVSVLSPLKDMKLTGLWCNGTAVSDLSPLKGMPLTDMSCDFKPFRDTEILRSFKTLDKINNKDAKLFWAEVNAQQSAFDAWVKQVAAMKAEQQVEAVKAELMKRNLDFTGKMTHKLDKDERIVTEISLSGAKVADLSPLRAFPGLTGVNCYGAKITDLSDLRSINLNFLNCGKTYVADLSALKGMKLSMLWCDDTNIHDLSPLKDMKLSQMHCGNTKVADLSPLKGMPLVSLSCYGTGVVDLSVLQGMPLKHLHFDFIAARDAAILRSIKTLEKINDKDAKDFWKEVDKK